MKLPNTCRLAGWILALSGGLLLPEIAGAESVSYRHEIAALLSRGGCNQGACHGNLNGKGGFKLSLRGEDPSGDFRILTRDALSRRLSPLHPESSLLLQKAAGLVPHEGGRRFPQDSRDYQLMRDWIAQGCPDDRATASPVVSLQVEPGSLILHHPQNAAQLSVKAAFKNGETRDVTHLAVFEASTLGLDIDPGGRVSGTAPLDGVILVRYLHLQRPVRLTLVPDRPALPADSLLRNNFIDDHLNAHWSARRLVPSELTSDREFLRRVYLDTLATLPTPEETTAFLGDVRPDKRARLIESLLHRPEFADYWALRWADLLRVEEKSLDARGVRAFQQWLRQAIAEGQPLNRFAADILTGRGSTYSNPTSNYYRALREPYARAETTAQVFLGIRLQCAKCHNHPFDRWTQDDYHAFASFFARVQYRIVENNRRDRLDSHEFDGEQIVYQDRASELKHPRTGDAVLPRLLLARGAVPAEKDRLQVLADWVADPQNPFFARAQVNRVWFHLMGRGLVDPLDDFRASNPALSEALLDALTADFVRQGFDLRQMVRTILNSRAYQLSTRPAREDQPEAEMNFARATVRPLAAEVLLDALAQVTQSPVNFPGQPRGTRAVQLPGVGSNRPRGTLPTTSERFLSVFGKPIRSLSCECERSEEPTLNQALQLLNGPLLEDLLQAPENRIGRGLSAHPPEAVITDLFLVALSRPPTSAERERAQLVVRRARSPRNGLEDVLWGVLNSKEFLLRP